MIITYGGNTLKLTQVVKWDQRAIGTDDNMDGLKTHIHIGAKCVFNPKGTASAPNALPTVSIAALRQAILTRRQTLTVTDDAGNVLLDTPGVVDGVRDHCDAGGGPIPIAFNVIEFIGVKTALVYFEIECWVVECAHRNTPMLSNRWSEEHVIDRKGYTTRTVSGEARFRKDALSRLGLVPHDYFWSACARIPGNFRREQIKVGTMPDGMTLYYTITDTQQPRNLNLQFGIVDFEAKYTAGYDWTHGGWLPSRHEQATIEVWGHSNSNRVTLAEACVGIAHFQGFTNPLDPGPFYGCSLTVDMKERYARLEMKWDASGALNGMANAAVGRNILQKIEDACENNILWTDRDTPGWGPFSAGTWLGRQVVQILTDGCETPARPVVPEVNVAVLDPE